VSGSSSGAEPARLRPLFALLAVLYAGGIWWESSESLRGIPGGPFWGFLGNSFHFALFGGLALLIAEALRVPDGLARARAFAVVALTTGYGVVDELHQRFTAGRSCDAGDVLVDALGAIGCLSLWWVVRARGRFATGALRFLVAGAAAAGFNAWRAWGGGTRN
jgi:hypothetical protein